jgi:membrane-associated PAP2 superfamily phosphatase
MRAALLSLIALLAWEVSGLDLALTGLFGGSAGFPWRDAWVTSGLLHGGGRWLSGALLALLAVDLAHPLLPGPCRGERLWGLLVALASMVAVPLLKRGSRSSCPWDLAAFGGSVPYVPHWWPGIADGGPGHCFPSGHAVAAFAFFSLWFVWRPHRPRLARALLGGVIALGTLFAAAQLVRGAHFLSHSAWSAWLCWVLARAALPLKPGAAVPTTNAWPTTLPPNAPNAPNAATAVRRWARRARSAG